MSVVELEAATRVSHSPSKFFYTQRVCCLTLSFPLQSEKITGSRFSFLLVGKWGWEEGSEQKAGLKEIDMSSAAYVFFFHFYLECSELQHEVT